MMQDDAYSVNKRFLLLQKKRVILNSCCVKRGRLVCLYNKEFQGSFVCFYTKNLLVTLRHYWYTSLVKEWILIN